MLYLTAPAIAHITTRQIGDGGDGPQSLWNIAWIRGWIEGHHGLFFTHQLFAPVGANLAWMTLALPVNAAAAVVSPLLGLVGSYNVMVLLSQTLNGVSMYHFARRLGVGWLAGLAAGATFIGSGHLVAEMLGHIHLLQAFLIIWFTQLLWGIFDSPNHLWLRAALLGATWAITFYAVEDYALYELAVALLVVFTHPAIRGERWSALLRHGPAWLLAAGIGLATSAPLWASLLWGPLSPGLAAIAQPVTTPYVVDLAGFLVPGPRGPFWWLGPHWSLSAALVEVAFPGFLVLAALYAAIRARWPAPPGQEGLKRLSLIGTGVFGVLELGPYLHVDGVSTAIPMPYLLLSHVPGWSVTLPVRLSVLTGLFGSLLVATMIDRLIVRVRWWSVGLKVGLVGAGVGLLALGCSWLPFPLSAVPTVVYATETRQAGGEVLFAPAVVPFTDLGSGPVTYMYWDAVLGLPTPEGYVSRIPSATKHRIDRNVVLRYLWSWQYGHASDVGLRQAAGSDLVSYLDRHDVRSIVVLTFEVSNAESRIAWLRRELGSRYRVNRFPDAVVFTCTSQ